MNGYSHPGVYLEELPTLAQPIAGASTSTAAFAGVTQRGPADRAELVLSPADFAQRYGGHIVGSHLAQAADHFFANGGSRIYVARVEGSRASQKFAAASGAPAALTVTALAPGSREPAVTVDVDHIVERPWRFDLIVRADHGKVVKALTQAIGKLKAPGAKDVQVSYATNPGGYTITSPSKGPSSSILITPTTSDPAQDGAGLRPGFAPNGSAAA